MPSQNNFTDGFIGRRNPVAASASGTNHTAVGGTRLPLDQVAGR